MGMKRLLTLAGLLLLAGQLLFGQAPGFGSSAAAGTAFLGGDPAQLTQRIMSSTRYRLTPGDVYLLTITMESAASFPLVLQQNYDIDVPYLNTVNVKGMYFTELYKTVTERLKKLLPLAQFVSLTLQSPARFDISVFGGVQTPGIVTVYPLSRVSDAIVLAGRLKPGASYRQVALIRAGERLRVDLLRYDSDGVSEENPYLEPGDRIYVPQAQITVAVSGQVKFPGSFELVPGETLGNVIAYAGGTIAGAQRGGVEVLRFDPDGTTTLKTVDLAVDAATTLTDGDRIRVPSVVENREMVLVFGAVFGAPVATDKPVQIPPLPVSVNVPYMPGLSLLSVLETVGGPTPYARAKESLVIRKKTGERLQVDVETLWSTRDKAKDVALAPGDTVDIPMVNEVFVAGEVATPGRLPFNPALLVGDYLLASGGASPDTADLNGIFFVDRQSGRTKTDLTSPVAPGALILVTKNQWTDTQKIFENVAVVTGFVGGVLGFLTAVIDFYIKIFVP
jgi:protein involved in polysaccharide export with SLBB domain